MPHLSNGQALACKCKRGSKSYSTKVSVLEHGVVRFAGGCDRRFEPLALGAIEPNLTAQIGCGHGRVGQFQRAVGIGESLLELRHTGRGLRVLGLHRGDVRPQRAELLPLARDGRFQFERVLLLLQWQRQFGFTRLQRLFESFEAALELYDGIGA